jgi:hypothetical protein
MRLTDYLSLDRCPHCGTHKPTLKLEASVVTRAHDNTNTRVWQMYKCTNCGGIVTAAASSNGAAVSEYYPIGPGDIHESIPDRASKYLKEATDTIHSGSASVMCSAGAIDAMLKSKGYKEGTLYNRIDAAAANHLITEEMAKWAHMVRIDANAQRHDDEEQPLSTTEDAAHALEFANAFAQFLFILPAKVDHGIKSVEGKPA